MDLFEKCIQQNTVFEGRIISVCDDWVELPGGRTAGREVVHHHGGVCILPYDGRYVYLVNQFRYPYREVVRELPAGKLEKGEDPLPAARRELREELGVTAGSLTDLGLFYPTPGYCDEVIHLYLAQQLQFGDQDLDPDEFLEIEQIELDQAVQEVLDGAIPDGKTQAALLKFYTQLQRSK